MITLIYFFNKSAPDILEFGLLLIFLLLLLLGIEQLYSWNKSRRINKLQTLEESYGKELEQEIDSEKTNPPNE
ncbi:MAG: hypothetical protein HYZ34_01105 [Ignavibacteriae bacterium]|nr:hypothetical protein [Ignavibacteriota bacterium]